jgi:ATP-dependent RNA helicase DDX19/DBP5
VVIGTPGKLKNWMSSKPVVLNANNMKVLVFDEADQMLDTEGFLLDSRRMISKITER